MSISAETHQDGRRTVHLPNEIIHRIINAGVEGVSIDDDTSSADAHRIRQQGKKNAVYFLLDLSVCSRLFHEIATPLLYRNIILSRRTFDNFNHPDANDIKPIALLLRTLVENPRFRFLAQELECFLFLRLPSYPLTEYTHGNLIREEWEFVQTNATPTTPISEADNIVLRYVKWPPPEPTRNIRERCFAAILMLLPDLRSLTLCPLPSRLWAAASGGSDPLLTRQQRQALSALTENLVTRPLEIPQETNDGKYSTLSALINGVFQPKNPLYNTKFQKLESLRLTTLTSFHHIDQSGDNNTHDIWRNRWTIQFNGCFGLLRCPRLTRLRFDDLDKPDPNQLPAEPLSAISTIQELIVSGPEPAQALTGTWPLSSLTVYSYASLHNHQQRTSYSDLASFDRLLTSMASTLKSLNICEGLTYSDPDRLVSLRSLKSLENLCIPTRLLCTTGQLKNEALADFLPPNIKRLGIMVHWNQYERGTLRPMIPIAFGQQAPPPQPPFEEWYTQIVSTSMVVFARKCKNTHPELTSVSLLRYSRPVKTLLDMKDGRRRIIKPDTAGVVQDVKEIGELFRTSGVAFHARYIGKGSSWGDDFQY